MNSRSFRPVITVVPTAVSGKQAFFYSGDFHAAGSAQHNIHPDRYHKQVFRSGLSFSIFLIKKHRCYNNFYITSFFIKKIQKNNPDYFSYLIGRLIFNTSINGLLTS